MISLPSRCRKVFVIPGVRPEDDICNENVCLSYIDIPYYSGDSVTAVIFAPGSRAGPENG